MAIEQSDAGSTVVCPDCGHPWGSHQRHRSQGDECVYGVLAPRSVVNCGCRTDNPMRVAEDERAAALWNAYLGREPR